MQQPHQHDALPSWLQEAMDADLTDDVLNKRSEPRHIFATPATVCPADSGDSAAPVRVRIFNASEAGLAFISREELEPGRVFCLHPRHEEDMGEDAVVNVRVIHCTQTVQGFKVGGSFE